jgi:hypothetical protein
VEHNKIRDNLYLASMLEFRSGRSYEELKKDIEVIAYHLWQQDGSKEGRCLDYWVAAEGVLLQQILSNEDDQ